jgi:hypothetical protein
MFGSTSRRLVSLKTCKERRQARSLHGNSNRRHKQQRKTWQASTLSSLVAENEATQPGKSRNKVAAK